jgi:ABC-type transport system substrate-binding protein
MRGWNPEWLERYEENYGYDPERARELLAEVEAEIGEPLDWSKLVFLITPRPEVTELADVGEAISNYWRDIGVDLKLEVQEFATFREHIIRGSVGGVAWADGTIRFEDPRMLEVVYYSGRDPAVGGICCHFFERDTIDSVFEKLVPATDFDVRDQLLREAGNFIYEEYALLPLFWMTASFTVNPEVVADYPTTGFRGAQDLEDVVAVKK